ncbi:MAG TPA: tellurite resistance TerB family protein [Myxococcales bacterium]|nr:tellurite resistance TerB family protein [Myxococcales bacterium]
MGKNGQVHFADETRQAALFEIMILAAGSDGDVSKVEVEEIYRRVFERPEFHGIHANDLRQAISRAAQHVAQVGELPVILQSISERLPDRPSRELAFGLAASVAWADRRTHPPELELLKALQKTFELDDADVARLYELAGENAPLPPTEAR